MKKKRQRIWAALLVMVLCLSLFPKSAFAEEVQTGFGVTIGEGAETFYTSFADAWNAACGKETSAVLTMYEDCTEITKYVVPQGKTVTLDLNGRAVENASNTQSGGFEVLGEFTLQDSASGGMIMGSGITVGNDEVSGTFTMKSGTIKGTMKEELNGRKTTGVWVFNGTFNMTGGTITEHRAGGVDVNMNTTFNMEGGEITNNTTGVTVSGAFNMKGGTISRNTSTEGGDSVHVYSPGKMTVKGSHTLDGSLVITSGAAMTIASDANLTLTGGAGLNNNRYAYSEKSRQTEGGWGEYQSYSDYKRKKCYDSGE